METTDYIAIISIAVTVIIAIVGGLYGIVTNTKKFELAEAYRKEILDWYSRTVNIMTIIISKIDSNDRDYKNELSLLSAQIEIGRFYFPNINKKDGYGMQKPSAYQGYRNIILDFLVYFYDTAKREDAKKHIKALREFLRLYTSEVFDVIKPKERIRKVKRHSEFIMKEEITLTDFLQDENNFKRFYKNKHTYN